MGTSPDLANDNPGGVLLAAIEAMIGHEVEADLSILGRHDQLTGPAHFSELRPACGSRFLNIGQSGIPIATHGVTDVEVFDGGVRWNHPVMTITLRCPALTRAAT